MLPKKGYLIPRARNIDYLPSVWNTISKNHPEMLKIHGIKFNCDVLFFEDGKGIWIYEQKEWNKIAQHLLRYFIHHPNYFSRIHRDQLKTGQALEKAVLTFLEQLKTGNFTLTKSIKSLFYLQKLWFKYDRINTLPWFVGAEALKDYLYLELEKLNIPRVKIVRLFLPRTLSLTTQEELARYKSALAVKSGKNKKKLARNLSDKFGWIPFGYDGPLYWDNQYFEDTLTSLEVKNKKWLKSKIDKILLENFELAKEQKNTINEYELNKYRRLINTVQTLITTADERKSVHFRIHYAVDLLLRNISKQTQLTLKELKYLDLVEINLLTKKKKMNILKDLARKRINNVIFVNSKNGKILEVIIGKKAKQHLSKYTEKISKANEVKGIVGSVGSKSILKGRIRRMLTAAEASKMKKGEILLTAMTSPDFVPAMRKAAAVVTDEGGLTCHAAIVSRELGISSIIGTRIATSIFKDGDLVELDTNKGIVKKI
ncbi:MAG: hypothetical protein A3I07_00470 [Candidatus Doudnabacteria bacterium RIFCSPLOWO2_02_FULL_42_9]|uniref:PEP-utilising enzyme mobile domain-containing protein n=1 Tax=Candidatus Doudnabacteria bacterium RIFCSPHIGHO2_01_FULL_41_86 TaxID=1817821 RepID=A0A1F5N975_9BACT|nr:MAG: hypothetical protein A2717_01795 [Candidatus Doudnabacteria bacterium RIFCSPHIGHO2_01_FULL_41_86]OGE74993.1 MAG: hypothetical protein A3K07_04455 [Candidatus Doudnabacteria bacterium RIFCSPHIGHO2_01_43_10]OGE85300.1 MAG: hypothetical protein A3E28_01365 [Candidatus Doudnabacteria bacterium RIFCSPHIGHO2_12_FULL_42_22]OGE86838.1 MAG: hypothetical protein A3C49_02200 [Candidatus Doudnabacteria bacterium RIFCSPHIGHO2_02_FULL_42_25]OGE92437.1 MAG: hypothetical protein A2895_02355 [Candidatus